MIYGRTEMLIGTKALEHLGTRHVAVFGIGGVGSFTVEALARSGVGHLTLIDKDTVDISNLNRQIHATQLTVGKPKVEVMKERILSINPNIKVTTFEEVYSADTAERILLDDYDYVVDAIDMVTSKIDMVVRCTERNIPIISAMGAANKLDPTKLEVTDIYKTSVCPLAKVMRHELKKRHIKKLKVVYSTETPIKPLQLHTQAGRRETPASVAFVPSVSGLIIAAEIVNYFIKDIPQQ
ncbi:MAG: tRNA cyclic N6-threonylcarbamoyladenosine(37) synthase TcdA [Epulopiscium sp. Nele67-Bin005]|nr:MAG: tRNA cyclic N6-threonylcarbamoyladenosine(37) synthase TcdA [Epulopiscium sp. Nele67-Bin005]